jgi:hypothetical protein
VLTGWHSGSIAAGFGVAVGTGALFIFGEVPRVRNDILRQLPFFDTYYDRSIAPEDNVSWNIHLELVFSGADVLLALLNYLARIYTCLPLDQMVRMGEGLELYRVEYQ